MTSELACRGSNPDAVLANMGYKSELPSSKVVVYDVDLEL